MRQPQPVFSGRWQAEIVRSARASLPDSSRQSSFPVFHLRRRVALPSTTSAHHSENDRTKISCARSRTGCSPLPLARLRAWRLSCMGKLDAGLRREFPAFCVTFALSPPEKSADGSSTPPAPDTLAARCTESTSQTCSPAHSENAAAASASKMPQPPSHSTTAPVPMRTNWSCWLL